MAELIHRRALRVKKGGSGDTVTPGGTTCTVGVGTSLPARKLVTITGVSVRVPDPERLVHLQFRRFAGCPICSAHMHSLAQRHDELRAASVLEVVVFHSSAEDLLAYQEQLPFAVVADPEKRLYGEFGVESAARALLHPRALLAGTRTMARKRRYFPADHHTGHLGLPADFLISSDGHVRACKRGSHAYDQWSVNQLLGLVGENKADA